jgi:hypothetical protein
MERLRRVFAIDLSICPDCGGRLRVTADVTRPDVIRKILQHVARQQAPPEFSAISSMATKSVVCDDRQRPNYGAVPKLPKADASINVSGGTQCS